MTCDLLHVRHETLFVSIPIVTSGYANEVGEAFRHVVTVRWVHVSYLAASSYVTAHALQQGIRAGKKTTHVSSHVSWKKNPE